MPWRKKQVLAIEKSKFFRHKSVAPTIAVHPVASGTLAQGFVQIGLEIRKAGTWPNRKPFATQISDVRIP
jgi:hypothetical protein